MTVVGTLRIVPKFGIPWVVKCRLKKLKPLDCSMLVDEKKSILKQTIWSKEGTGSVSILFLEPGAEVKQHTHTQDVELYIFWDWDKEFLVVKSCKQGQSHSLRNKSKKRWAWVLSIKFDMPKKK